MEMLFVLFVACNILLANAANIVNCPQKCHCSMMMGSLEVDCSRQGLMDYPQVNNLHVESLNLAHNQFTYFPKHFADIPTLIMLDLSHNQIAYIEPDTFLGFTNLRVLYLDNNTIQSWAHISANEAFLEAIRLDHLSLNDNYLSTFDDTHAAARLNSSSISKLELQRCGITHVGGTNLLEGLPYLEHLQLSGNPITKLDLLPSQTLVEIQLAECGLKTFSNQFMLNLPNLKYLNLSGNSGVEFEIPTPLSSEILAKLDLSYCQPNILDIRKLPRLTYLNLRGNMLRSISNDFFINNPDLEMIDLSKNMLAHIATNAFNGLRSLNRLELSYNEIAQLDKNMFSNNDKLTMINLSRNALGKFSTINCKSLRDIHLSWNEIIQVDGDIFSGIPLLQRLDLSNNLLKEFPAGLQALHLQKLDLSNCRLTTLRNNTFRDFPKLTTLRLNGNRFTNTFSPDYFKSNKLLDDLLLGDNPWMCNCKDPTFEKFYTFLTTSPRKVKDAKTLRCASPAHSYGEMWAVACAIYWVPEEQKNGVANTFSAIMYIIGCLILLIILCSCLKKCILARKRRLDRREYDSNMEEMNEIRRLNQQILREDSTPNAPNTTTNRDTALPSYEAAMLMPKSERPVKSMLDLRASKRKFWQRFRPDSEEEPELDLMLNRSHRSEEMLSSRDTERTLPRETFRRTGDIDKNYSGSRRFIIEDSRFPSANLKNQNLQSAEQIGNFQSYENSPYTKRKPQIAEIPPFKRATIKADSVEFLTDPEFDGTKKASPFARRKPKPTTPVFEFALTPDVENYFSVDTKNQHGSSDGSAFHMILQPDVGSSAGDLSAMSPELSRNKRKKRKNSNRRLSGNMSAAAAEVESSASDQEPMVVVHKPLRETIF